MRSAAVDSGRGGAISKLFHHGVMPGRERSGQLPTDVAVRTPLIGPSAVLNGAGGALQPVASATPPMISVLDDVGRDRRDDRG
jgi:hypothetical protein